MVDPNTTSEAFQPSTLGFIIIFAGWIAAIALPPIRKALWVISNGIAACISPTAAGIGWLRPIFAVIGFVLLLAVYAFVVAKYVP